MFRVYSIITKTIQYSWFIDTHEIILVFNHLNWLLFKPPTLFYFKTLTLQPSVRDGVIVYDDSPLVQVSFYLLWHLYFFGGGVGGRYYYYHHVVVVGPVCWSYNSDTHGDWLRKSFWPRARLLSTHTAECILCYILMGRPADSWLKLLYYFINLVLSSMAGVPFQATAP